MIVEIVKAINQHVKDNSVGFNVKYIGDKTDVTPWSDWLEVRLVGPDIIERTSGNFQYDFIVDIACVTETDHSYKLHVLEEKAAELLEKVFMVEGVCVKRVEGIKINRFEKIIATTVRQSAVYQAYELYIRK